MGRIPRIFCAMILVSGVPTFTVHAAGAASNKPTVAQALGLSPIQSDIEIDRPAAAGAEKCTIETETGKGVSGWLVKNESGMVLRRFMDSNGDNKVDQWCYFKDGVEVYRDVDADHNGKAEQCRWMGTAGTRWGLDRDEDGRLDGWKSISAEEVSDELVIALQSRDAARFKRLLPDAKEISSLGLSEEGAALLGKKATEAAARFSEIAGKQKLVGTKAKWLHFVAVRPGIVPAGTDGSTKDLLVYENAIAMIESEGKTQQLQLGALVRVGEAWRIIDLPSNLQEGVAGSDTGFFLKASFRRPEVESVGSAGGGISEASQKLVTQLEAIDKQLATASPKELAALNSKRSDVLESLVKSAGTPQEKSNWVHQYAETLTAAVQSDGYAEGVDRLKSLLALVEKDGAASPLIPYVKFRSMQADYSRKMAEPKADFAKIQEKWLENLASFVEKYPDADDSAEALLQLAIAKEFAGSDDEAGKLYTRIARDFPKASMVAKAIGAAGRLKSEGKPIGLKGPTVEGKEFDLASYRGRMVVIHYWATWCEPCKQDMDTLARLQAKYAKQGLSLVGVNVDQDRKTAAQFLTANRYPWPHLYETGGLDSRLANELGIVTLPTMMLIDGKGNVVSRSIQAGELDTELGKRLK